MVSISQGITSPFKSIKTWAQSPQGKAKIQTAAIVVGVALAAIALVGLTILALHSFNFVSTGHAIVHLAKSGWEMFAPALPLKMAMRN